MSGITSSSTAANAISSSMVQLRRANLEDVKSMACIKLANVNPFSSIVEGLDERCWKDGDAALVDIPQHALAAQEENIRTRLAAPNAFITVAVLRQGQQATTGRDENDDDVVGWAMWRVFDTPQPREEEPFLDEPVQESSSSSDGDDARLSSLRQSCIRDFKTGLIRGRNKYIAGQANIRLSNLFTHPLHHRKGVGSALINQGTSLADSKNLPSYVEASPMGKTLYARHGYVEIGSFSLDLRKYKVNNTRQGEGEGNGGASSSDELDHYLYTTTLMIRQPASRKLVVS